MDKINILHKEKELLNKLSKLDNKITKEELIYLTNLVLLKESILKDNNLPKINNKEILYEIANYNINNIVINTIYNNELIKYYYKYNGLNLQYSNKNIIYSSFPSSKNILIILTILDNTSKEIIENISNNLGINLNNKTHIKKLNFIDIFKHII